MSAAEHGSLDARLLLRELSADAMSVEEDEEDEDSELPADRSARSKRYALSEWRSQTFISYLRSFDSKPARTRRPPLKYVTGLPRSCYSEEWLSRLNAREISHLHIDDKELDLESL